MQHKDINEEIIDLHKKIGQNVQLKRVEKGFTQLKLAEAIGHSSTTIISQAEIGSKKHFNIEQLYRISKILECNIADFLN